MLELRKAESRGYADHGWLKSFHSFSFADYYDPKFMGFGALRVINEDRVAPGMGFGTHGHRDMEIISYVLDGALAHQDSMGNGSTIRPGDVQRMSAGTGVRHSEFNHAKDATTHFLQIWIEPSVTGIARGDQTELAALRGSSEMFLFIGRRDARDGSVTIHANASLYAGCFTGDETAQLLLAAGRRAYVHVVRGRVNVNGNALNAGDAAKLIDQTEVVISQGTDAEVLVFDLE
jgi:redox-sensitive bicupin YhaK (pirin superfamily)